MITLMLAKLYVQWFARGAYNFLSSIPLKVWLAVVAVVVALYYGHYREQKGVEACQQAIRLATQKEKDRQQKVVDKVVEDSITQALEAQRQQEELERQVQDAMDKVRQFEKAGAVCLPAPITDSLRRIGSQPQTKRGR